MVQQVLRVVLRNTVWHYGAAFVSLAVGVILVPIMVHHLGDTLFGLWVLVSAVSGYSRLLDLGLAPSIVKWVARYRAESDQEEMNDFLSTMFVAYLGIGVLALGGTAIIASVFDRVFSMSPDQVGVARLLLLITGLTLAIDFPMSVFGAVLTAYQRSDINDVLSILHLLLGLSFTLGVLSAGYGLLAMALVQLVVVLVTQAVRVLLAWRVNPAMVLRLGRFHWQRMQAVRDYSFFVFTQAFARQVALKTDEVVIGLFLPLSAVASYSIGLRLANALRTLAEQLVDVLFPVAADLHARHRAIELQRVTLMGSCVVLGLGIPPALGVLVLAGPLISLWVGHQYVASASPVAAVLACGMTAAMIHWVPVTIARAAGHVRVPGLVAVGEAMANLALSVLLVTSFGIVGVALGTMVPAVATSLLVQTPYACRVLGIPLRVFAREVIMPHVLTAVPVGAGLYLATVALEPDTLAMILGLFGATVLAYWTAFTLCWMPRPELREFGETLGRIVVGWARPN
jgi:O-antigen/teichoic acid export membrane protein